MKALLTIALICSAALPALAQQFTEVDPKLPKYLQPCVAWGDYDGDGDLDVLVSGLGSHDIATTEIYKNTGGVFTNSGIVLTGLARGAAAWGDFDGDGDLDLAITGLTSASVPTTIVYRNNGGTFTPVASSFLGVFGGSVSWADYDGDGDLDLLVNGSSTAGATGTPVTRLYRNDGNGVFTSVPHPFPNVYFGASAAWGDYDNDGKIDVVITGVNEAGLLVSGIWHNDGGGHFTDIGANLPGMDLGMVAWGDYDNDGDLDLLFVGNLANSGIGTSRIYRNDGGTFTDINAGMLGLVWASAAWGDYDNDGDLDVMITGYDIGPGMRRSILYRNDAGTFVDSGNTFRNIYLGLANWVDYDNDGKLDLWIAGNELGGDIFFLYHNNNLTANTAPSAPTNLAVNVLGTSVEVSWSAGSDAQTPAAALSYNWRVGTVPGSSNIVAAQSSSAGYRRLAAMGNVQSRLGASVRGLVPGTTYYWSVQSVDTAFAGSGFAAEGSFMALADPPQNISFARDAGGVIHAIWRGTPGSTYRVDVSPDLQGWSPAATPVAAVSTGLFELLETPVTSVDRRFYRAARP